MDVAIIDDEELSIKDLSVKLEKYPDINIVSITTSASKGLEFINKRSPDVAFLDVEMPEMSGMAFLDELEDNNCKIVMYTSHQDYMLSSFRKDAFDYLMKPIDPEELASVIEHCEKHIAEHSKEPKAANIKTNLINEKLLLYTNTSDFQLVHIKDIGMFVYNSERRIWEIIVARRDHSIPLKRSINRNMIQELDKHFIQVSQSYIININYLIEVIDNTCNFYPPFDHIKDVPLAFSSH
jgi:two-component system LytT family response regulator